MSVVRDLAYFVSGDAGKGPGVLLLHSLWGLTSSVKGLCDSLADEGFTVLAPDINFGELPATEAEGIDRLGEASPDRLAALVLTTARLVDAQSAPGPIGIVGFGMGGSLALWASVRLPEVVAATVSFYGTQQIDFAGSKSSYLVHFAEEDRVHHRRRGRVHGGDDRAGVVADGRSSPMPGPSTGSVSRTGRHSTPTPSRRHGSGPLSSSTARSASRCPFPATTGL